MASGSKTTTLCIGLNDRLLQALSEPMQYTHPIQIPFDLKALSRPITPVPDLILVSLQDFKTSMECAQALRMAYPDTPLYLCCNNKDAFERTKLMENGFTDVFLFPYDLPLLEAAVLKCVIQPHASKKLYRSVKMLDIDEGETLDFDTSIFMPSNNKYIKTSVAGNEIDAGRLEKIRKNNINNLHVPLEQIQKFYDFSAKKLHKIETENPMMSATERRDRLAHSVRELLTGLFSSATSSYEDGQDVMQNCRGIVSSYILQGSNADWYQRIQQVLGDDADHYSHSSNTSAFAALFSMGMGIGNPEDLALAGLLHDVGESQLPAEIQLLEPEKMTREQLEIYQKHPEYTTEIIRQKKIVVPEMVMKIIAQHHENFDGSGYPRGYLAEKFSKEAQVLALADEFDRLTQLKPGSPAIPPLKAVQMMIDAQSTPSSPIKFDPALLEKLLSLFTPEKN